MKKICEDILDSLDSVWSEPEQESELPFMTDKIGSSWPFYVSVFYYYFSNHVAEEERTEKLSQIATLIMELFSQDAEMSRIYVEGYFGIPGIPSPHANARLYFGLKFTRKMTVRRFLRFMLKFDAIGKFVKMTCNNPEGPDEIDRSVILNSGSFYIISINNSGTTVSETLAETAMEMREAEANPEHFYSKKYRRIRDICFAVCRFDKKSAEDDAKFKKEVMAFFNK